jgi:hypothetical protein
MRMCPVSHRVRNTCVAVLLALQTTLGAAAAGIVILRVSHTNDLANLQGILKPKTADAWKSDDEHSGERRVDDEVKPLLGMDGP